MDTLNRNFYVDDLLKSVENVKTAIRFLHDVIIMCADGGFRLTKFLSNQIEVLDSISEEDRRTGVKDVYLNSGANFPTEKAVGVNWDMSVVDLVLSWTRSYQWSVKCTIQTSCNIPVIGQKDIARILQKNIQLGWWVYTWMGEMEEKTAVAWKSENGDDASEHQILARLLTVTYIIFLMQAKMVIASDLFENNWWERLCQVQFGNGKIKSSTYKICFNFKTWGDSNSNFHKDFNYVIKITHHSFNNQGAVLDR